MYRRRPGNRHDCRGALPLVRSVSVTLLPVGLRFLSSRPPPNWLAVSSKRKRMAIQRVGVVGCGLMGSGIAQVAAQSGFTTIVREVSPELVDKGLKSVDKNLGRLVEKGAITEAQKMEMRGRLKG